jgi:hypothetical protein
MYMSRRHGAPLWILPLTAAFHDVGKTVSEFQSRARRSCRAGSKPSFPLHEYLGALPLLAMSYLEGWRDAWKSLWFSVAAAGVVLHHHGMSGRLMFLSEALKVISAKSKVNLDTDAVLLMAEVGLEACRLSYEISARLGARHSSILSKCVEAAREVRDRLKDENNGLRVLSNLNALSSECKGFPAQPPLWVTKLFRGLYLTDRGEPVGQGLESYWALSTFVGGAVSLADTAVSSYWRSGGISRYALRVLGEDPWRLRAAKSLLERIQDMTG